LGHAGLRSHFLEPVERVRGSSYNPGQDFLGGSFTIEFDLACLGACYDSGRLGVI
jgi:hypothetical protein